MFKKAMFEMQLMEFRESFVLWFLFMEVFIWLFWVMNINYVILKLKFLSFLENCERKRRGGNLCKQFR